MVASWISVRPGSIATVTLLAISYFALPVRAGQLNRLYIDAGACLKQPPEKMAKCARDLASKTRKAYEKDYDPASQHSTVLPERLLKLNSAADYHETDQFLQEKLQKAKAWKSKEEFYSKYEQEHGKSDPFESDQNDAPDRGNTNGANSGSATASRTEDSDGSSSQNSNASAGGGQAALHDNCLLKTAIFNARSTLLVLKNVCSQTLSVYWCFQPPDGTGWACSPDNVSSGATTANSSQQIGALCEIDRGWGKTHGCQGVPPWPVVFNATYAAEGQAPKPNVNDSSQHSVH
jgi:hypothetical protein